VGPDEVRGLLSGGWSGGQSGGCSPEAVRRAVWRPFRRVVRRAVRRAVRKQSGGQSEGQSGGQSEGRSGVGGRGGGHLLRFYGESKLWNFNTRTKPRAAVAGVGSRGRQLTLRPTCEQFPCLPHHAHEHTCSVNSHRSQQRVCDISANASVRSGCDSSILRRAWSQAPRE
jgi:hypothetical protein